MAVQPDGLLDVADDAEVTVMRSHDVSVNTDCSSGSATNFWLSTLGLPISGSVVVTVATSSRTAWRSTGSLIDSINIHVVAGMLFKSKLRAVCPVSRANGILWQIGCSFAHTSAPAVAEMTSLLYHVSLIHLMSSRGARAPKRGSHSAVASGLSQSKPTSAALSHFLIAAT